VTLTELERERYARQLSGWGEEAQERLRDAHVIVVGLGSLGSPAALYLAAAGVGRLGVVDPAVVELGDLPRQPLHFTPDLGIPKAQNAAVKLRALNPEVVIEPYPARVDADNAPAIVAGADVVVDCTGGVEVNDACCAAGIPLVWGATTGHVLAVRPGESACLRCAFGGELPLRLRGPGALAGIVGSMQALEALKLLTGMGRPLLDTLLQFDGETMEGALLPVARRDECPSCALPAAAQSA
jgi:molybdopterin/thiamine biosynthesis adenylyltransferase